MKPANSDSLITGFSLIEAMAALALTAIIILALSSVAGQWLPNWRRGLSTCSARTCSGTALSGSSTTCARQSTCRPRPAPRRHFSRATLRQ